MNVATRCFLFPRKASLQGGGTQFCEHSIAQMAAFKWLHVADFRLDLSGRGRSSAQFVLIPPRFLGFFLIISTSTYSGQSGDVLLFLNQSEPPKDVKEADIWGFVVRLCRLSSFTKNDLPPPPLLVPPKVALRACRFLYKTRAFNCWKKMSIEFTTIPTYNVDGTVSMPPGKLEVNGRRTRDMARRARRTQRHLAVPSPLHTNFRILPFPPRRRPPPPPLALVHDTRVTPRGVFCAWTKLITKPDAPRALR